MKVDTKTVIVDVASEMIRRGGYGNFSFRSIAKKVGIKSSSVHYHFATKEDLGAAIVKNYANTFINSFGGEPEELLASGVSPIETYVDSFRDSRKNDKGMCLCGLLGSEIEVLPKLVKDEVRVFFKRNIDWLMKAYRLKHPDTEAQRKAIQTLALLEGAMITCNSLDDESVFEAAVQAISE